MKRLALSLVCGFTIPALYILALALFFLWTGNLRLVLWLRYPVNWPTFILVHVLPLGSFPLRAGDRLFLIPLVIICDAIAYSIPIYLVLWRFSIRKRKSMRLDLPPDPPSFVQH
jgi:hypothetical protein